MECVRGTTAKTHSQTRTIAPTIPMKILHQMEPFSVSFAAIPPIAPPIRQRVTTSQMDTSTAIRCLLWPGVHISRLAVRRQVGSRKTVAVPSLRFEGRVPNEKKNSWSSVGRRENVSREPSGLIVKIYPLPIDLNLYSRNGVNLPYRGSLCADYTYSSVSYINQPLILTCVCESTNGASMSVVHLCCGRVRGVVSTMIALLICCAGEEVR